MSDEQTEPQADTFWADITIPTNADWKANNVEFVNPVVVADKFAEAPGIAAELGGEAERITQYIDQQTVELEEFERKLARLRRDILRDNYSKATKGASSEVQSAYIHSVAGAHLPLLREYEDAIEERERNIGKWTPRLNLLRGRLKAMVTHLEWAEQYINYEKHVSRATMPGRRT